MSSVRSFVATFFTVVLAAGAVSAQTLPTGWSTKDVGAVAAAGSATSVNNIFTVAGSGADVWGTADEFRFVYQQLTGDSTIITRVSSMENVNAWVKAGVMMRETLSANSKHAFMIMSPGYGLAFQRRTATGGSTTHTDGGAKATPYYVGLKRTGNTFTAYKSVDGVSWTVVGSQSITMASTIYVGLAVSSHVDGVLADATFSNTATTSSAAIAPAPAPAPAPSSTSLRLLQWNVHHGGIGTDGKYDPNRIAAWIAKMNPDVASLNEVDTPEQVSAILSGLRAATGVTWGASFSGLGTLVVSRLPLASTSKCAYDPAIPDVYAAHASVIVNGRPINVFSAHLHVGSASARYTEAKTLQACASNWAEARIITGDYNMQYGTAEYNAAATGYGDAWLSAKALGTAYNFSGNCDGCTRNSRIDYVFTSKGATSLTLKSAQIFDTRDANGYMASDHKPMLVVYTVR